MLWREAWHETPEDLDIVDGMVISYKSEKETPLANIVIYGLPKPNDEGWMGGPIVGRGSFMPKYVTNLDPETGQGARAVVHYTVGCEGIDIEIEKETGRIHVVKAASAFDVGKAINPELAKATDRRRFCSGIELCAIRRDPPARGVMTNPSFRGLPHRHFQRMLISSFTPILVEVPQDDGPWGARGVGEHPMCNHCRPWQRHLRRNRCAATGSTLPA